jgi:hypothetical protein
LRTKVWNILIGDSERMNMASEYPSNHWTVINIIVQDMGTGDLTAIARQLATNWILSHWIFRRNAAWNIARHSEQTVSLPRWPLSLW